MLETGAYKKRMAMQRPGELGALAVHEPRESGVRGAAAQGPVDLGLSPADEGKMEDWSRRACMPLRHSRDTPWVSQGHRSHCGPRVVYKAQDTLAETQPWLPLVLS